MDTFNWSVEMKNSGIGGPSVRCQVWWLLLSRWQDLESPRSQIFWTYLWRKMCYRTGEPRPNCVQQYPRAGVPGWIECRKPAEYQHPWLCYLSMGAPWPAATPPVTTPPPGWTVPANHESKQANKLFLFLKLSFFSSPSLPSLPPPLSHWDSRAGCHAYLAMGFGDPDSCSHIHEQWDVLLNSGQSINVCSTQQDFSIKSNFAKKLSP